MMRINSVIMHNFRQYKDLELSFAKKTDYDLHFILAENGIGKTTLLNAINWCLYGDEPHIGIKSKALPLINLSTFRNMNVGDTEDVSVSIEIEVQNGIVKFERTWTIRKTEEKKDYILNKNRKAISCLPNSCAEIFENDEADKYVNKFVPKRIRKFFFFDGEQMDTYFTDVTGVNVENSIFEISQIDLLNSMYTNLKTISTELRRDAAKLNPKVTEINEKYEVTAATLEALNKLIEDCKKQLGVAKSEYRRCCDSLGDEPDIEDLERQRNILSKKITELDSVRSVYYEELKILIKKYTIIFNALPQLKSMYSVIKEKEENNQLPPKIDKDELKKMLEGHTCLICNRPLDGQATVNIESLIEKYELNNESANLLTAIRGNIESLIREASKYPNERKLIIDNIKRIDDEKKESVTKYNEIESIVEKYTDKEHIKMLYAERKKYEDLIKNLERDLIITERDYKDKDDECKNYKIQLDKELDKDKKQSLLIREKDIAEKATSIVGEIIEEIKNDVREKISNEMNTIFFKLIWKKATFSDVKLSESYLISLINVDGYECLGTCSAAERELLALAFTLALHKESGFDAPLVIDTPISRVSGILRDKVAKVLRDISGEKQIILYLTEDEYSIQVRDVFEPCASSKYALTLSNEEFVEKRCL